MIRPEPPLRDGLNAVPLRLPDADFATVAEYLTSRFGAAAIDAIAAGDVLDQACVPLTIDSPYQAGARLWIYRKPAPEAAVPFEVDILYRDDDLLVVDKPHFLATMPRGRHVTESVVVRLRRQSGLADCTPAHRLDRLTAGVLVCTLRPDVRRAYQELFASRDVSKVYEAIGPAPTIAFPRTVRSRIVKERGVLQAREVAGDANSETRISVLETAGGFARYECTPITGKTHQIRVHLNSLGVPIVGDPLYPEVLADGPTDFSNPLRLLAKSIAFRDPTTGRRREFRSRRRLEWPDQSMKSK